MSYGRSHRPAHPAAAALLALLALGAGGCERVDVDPSVAEGPLPSPAAPVDSALAEAGRTIYERRCLACHALDGREVVGPSLAGVTGRRDYPWIRGMVLSPDSMLRVDAEAQALLERYDVPMMDTELDEARFRAVLEFLRMEDAEESGGSPPG